MNAKSFRYPTIQWVPALLLLALACAPRPAVADGVACLQDCDEKGCGQTACGEAVSVPGYCQCQSAALPWAGTTYSSWCRVSGTPKGSSLCASPETVSRRVASDSAALLDGLAMMQALESRNPYVATLIDALQQSGSWVAGTVQGLIHDSQYDEISGDLSNGTAVPFTGGVTTGGLDSAQVQITVNGDLRQLTGLKQYVDSMAGAPVPPASVHGTVTDGGLHGSLLVVGLDGASETIQW